MKKSLIALSLVSVFAAGVANAYEDVNPIDIAQNQAISDLHKKSIKQDNKINDNKNAISEVQKQADRNTSRITNAERRIDTNTDLIHVNAHDIEKNKNKINDVDSKVDDVARNAKADRDRIYDEGSKAIVDIYKDADAAAKYIDATGRQAVDAVGKNTSDIADLRKDFTDMSQRQDRFEDKLNKMDKKMDGVMAGTHAVTNARPMVAGGQTAFGVGTGFAGSAQAVAVGVAHNFKDSAWSVSATTNVSTGSGVKTQVSGGVGAHYVF
ncbi:YadA C-terminal domain-containing protein [Photobacterium rosenbergii]|uniref:YadA C-terminal domain-containing protein n=1 Tax=Photobacterium rosenbergii TaxID=294936 RepID=UPI001C9A23EB|nr:YadA C-terminal domain-containing protein [Photobacterium rosenbergii]MBY5945245.1 YadA-like family protein [Photobacterium rosenbergii]